MKKRRDVKFTIGVYSYLFVFWSVILLINL